MDSRYGREPVSVIVHTGLASRSPADMIEYHGW
jgi:hypothetical protein